MTICHPGPRAEWSTDKVGSNHFPKCLPMFPIFWHLSRKKPPETDLVRLRTLWCSKCLVECKSNVLPSKAPWIW